MAAAMTASISADVGGRLKLGEYDRVGARVRDDAVASIEGS